MHATAVTASQSMPAGLLSVRTMASYYNCYAHSRVHSTFRTCFVGDDDDADADGDLLLSVVFTRDSIYAIARLCDSDVSVCPSVTRRYCA